MTDWSPADLDRCEHGRHAIDLCVGCPHGRSTGNLFLLPPEPDCACYPVNDPLERVRIVDGLTQVRIGTMVRGEPIWVTPALPHRGD